MIKDVVNIVFRGDLLVDIYLYEDYLIIYVYMGRLILIEDLVFIDDEYNFGIIIGFDFMFNFIKKFGERIVIGIIDVCMVVNKIGMFM